MGLFLFTVVYGRPPDDFQCTTHIFDSQSACQLKFDSCFALIRAKNAIHLRVFKVTALELRTLMGQRKAITSNLRACAHATCFLVARPMVSRGSLL